MNKSRSVAETSGSAHSLLECADAGQRVDILVFVRGSARPLDPRGAKVGGGIWASWVGGAGEVGGEGFRALVARRGGRGGLSASGLRGGRRWEPRERLDVGDQI